MIFDRPRVDQTLLHISAAGDQIQKKPILTMIASGFYLPKNNPKKPQGEDAYFLCLHHQTLGVADGVGDWAREGIDAGQYARDLMPNAAFSVLHQPKGSVIPRTALNEAFLNTKAGGSSTACIATLEEQSLHAVNMGDSGFMLFRNKRPIYQCPTQQHCFNTPYQLGNSEGSDKPESAVELEVGVEDGDVVVFGTDGAFDNMYPSEREEVIKLEIEEGRGEPPKLAMILAELALCNSVDACTRTPFDDAAGMAGVNHRGGKIDDITVLVAHVVSCM